MAKSDQKSADVNNRSTSWKESPFLLLKGFLMGSADIVPGVSGGTMALIVGIYTRLINAISSFDGAFIKRLFTFNVRAAFHGVDWKFMLILLSGMAAAVLFFTKVVPLQVYMFTDPELIFGLFFGLILGSIFILAKAIDGFNWVHGVMIGLGSLIGFWVVIQVPTATPESPLFVFLAGSVAICAMILPGISGSYILLILRKYDFVLTQIGKLGTSETADALLILLPFGVGAIVGLALFSRLLSWLLDRYQAQTLALLVGFLVGSLYVIWPYQNRTYKQIVEEKQIIEYTSPQAEELRSNPPDKNRPEFYQLGRVINGDANIEELKKVELLIIKQKLIRSEPYIPYVTIQGSKTAHFGSGILGIIIGLVMVLGLDYLRVED